MRVVLSTIAFAACGSMDSTTPDPLPPDLQPTADRRPVASLRIPAEITLGRTVRASAGHSYDVEGAPLAFQWSLQGPSGSLATLDTDDGVEVSFTPDRAGAYRLELVVSDGSQTSEPVGTAVVVQPVPPEPEPDPVPERIVDLPPTVSAGKDVLVELGASVQLTGTAIDPEHGSLQRTWSFEAVPTGSDLSFTSTSSTLVFTPDYAGVYRLLFSVSDPFTTVMDEVVVEVAPPLGIRHDPVVDAEYSRTLDRLVLVSEPPGALHILDPATSIETTIPLPLEPRSVALDPTGQIAAVGHDGWISLVDLVEEELDATVAVTHEVADTLFDGQFVFTFPGSTIGGADIRVVDVQTSAETVGFTLRTPNGAAARWRPDHSAFYMANSDRSPDDLFRATLSAPGTLESIEDSVYHGTYSICSDLWFDGPGQRILTACGHLFESTDDPLTDMTYLESMPGVSSITWMEASPDGASWAMIPDDESRLRFVDSSTLQADTIELLPSQRFDGTLYDTHGRWVFWRSDGSEVYVVATTDIFGFSQTAVVHTVEAP